MNIDLDAIQAPERERRAAVAYAIRDTLPTRNAWDMADAAIEAAGVPALLAYARELAIQLEGVRSDMQDAMADAWDEGVTTGLGWDENRGKDFNTPNPYRA